MYDSLKTNNEGHHCPPGAYSRCVAMKGGALPYTIEGRILCNKLLTQLFYSLWSWRPKKLNRSILQQYFFFCCLITATKEAWQMYNLTSMEKTELLLSYNF